MNLTILNNQILKYLNELNVKDLPNLPNLNGIFQQTEITFAIINGKRISNEKDKILITFNVSIAASTRIENVENPCTGEENKTLFQLINLVTSKLDGAKVRNGGIIKLSDFENYTPDTGKWRCLLTFTVPFYLFDITQPQNPNINGECNDFNVAI